MEQILDNQPEPGTLAAVRAARRVEDQAARDAFIAAAGYAAAHMVNSRAEAASLETVRVGRGYEVPGGGYVIDGVFEHHIPLTGEGAPLIAEDAVIEFAAALGYSALAGRGYLADVVEVRWRLPRLWTRILDGTLTVSRARRVADVTRSLGYDAARWVDQQVADHAHKTGPRQLERVAREAAALFEPDVAAAVAEEAIEQRKCDINTDPVLVGTGVEGAEQGDAAVATAEVHATLDVADALDLEAAVATIAHALLDDDPTRDLSLDARRAAALGVLARAYNSGTMSDTPGTGRVIELVIHTDTRDLDGTGLVRIQNTRGLATIEQLHRWATTPGTRIKPIVVVDLAEEIITDRYTPTPAQRRQAELLHATCAFPHCTNKAEHCDLDHQVPYDTAGRTESSNLTPLCRRHHRAKTHMGWTYQRLGPGRYLWRSPRGYTYVTGPEGTIDTSPDLDLPARSAA